MSSRTRIWASLLCVFGFCLGAILPSCGKKEVPYDTNLLKNPSFEETSNGMPKHWELADFHGIEGQDEVGYGVASTLAQDGQNSWFFRGDPGTRRWRHLTQEIEVENVTHIRLRGWMKLEDVVKTRKEQISQCNFVLMYFDENHNRFQLMRFGDKRTRLKKGTTDWVEVDQVFRVPDGTRYIAVSCIMGMDGQVWFDNVSLSIPQPLEWQTSQSKNFVFHWMRARPFPLGSMESQQQLFDQFAKRLGVESDVVINYYLYPDTSSIRQILSLKGHQYVSWDDREIHTINPNENHEIIHFITDEYGQAPRAIAEGTVYWLHGNWEGTTVHVAAAKLLADNRLPTVEDLTNYLTYANIDPGITNPAAASFVGYVVDRFGTERFMELHGAMSGVNSYGLFALAFQKVYEVPCREVATEWRIVLSNIKTDAVQEASPEQ